MSNTQKVFIDYPLSDDVRCRILNTPNEALITNTTSNYQRSPSYLVLLNDVSPLHGVTNVSVTRSRQSVLSSATITLENKEGRYSGPNKHKLAPNTPISIYLGYDHLYYPVFTGTIDIYTLDTSAQSIVTIECRDKGKHFLETKISGTYSEDDIYLGVGQWHYKTEYTSEGAPVKMPRPWVYSEVIKDICKMMELNEEKEVITVTKSVSPTGIVTYDRNISTKSEYDINVDAEYDTPIKVVFVEESPLDCLSKLAQACMSEVFFDSTGTLIVRPIKDASAPVNMHLKEERDIISIQEKVSDDNVTNICTVIGQTASETSVIYPFAPVAGKDGINVEKGKDVFGESVEYPAVVSQEAVQSLKNPSLFAPVIYPGQTTPYSSASDNPENYPHADFRIHYPNFNSPYEKQQVLTASCPIITDAADYAEVSNTRFWPFAGSPEEAVSYDKQPIKLIDRFNNPYLVVLKERSMNKDDITWCGSPYNTLIPEEGDSSVPVELTTLQGWGTRTDGINYVDYSIIDTTPIPFAPIYHFPIPTQNNIAFIVGYKDIPPAEATFTDYPIPEGLSSPIGTDGWFKIMHLSGLRVDPDDFLEDRFSVNELFSAIKFFRQTTTIKKLMYTRTYDGRIYREYRFTTDDKVVTTVPLSSPVLDIESGCVNCKFEPNSDGNTELILLDNTPFIEDMPIDTSIWRLNSTTDYTYSHYTFLYGKSPAISTGNLLWTYTSGDTNIDTILHYGSEPSYAGFLQIIESKVSKSFSISSNPDTNCVYFRFYGGYADGKDHNGNARVMITRDDFYKYAADPTTIVIELITEGSTCQAYANLLELTEDHVKVLGHNLYGSMQEEMEALADQLETMFRIIGVALIVVAIACATPQEVISTSPGVTTGSPGSLEAISMVSGLVGLYLILGVDFGDVGKNISKVMENMECKIYATRKEEIHLTYNEDQAFRLVDRKGDTHFTHQFSYDDPTNGPCMVYIMDITQPGDNGIPFGDNILLTALGWETPEIGDSSPIQYYTGGGTRRRQVLNFMIEAYGSDAHNSAEYYLGKRFTGSSIGSPVDPQDEWMTGDGYELLVDRSHADITISDRGLWWDFFERKESWQPRSYKYISIIIFKNKVMLYNKSDDSLVNSYDATYSMEDTFNLKNYGVYIPRGLDNFYYNKFRWITINDVENNYIRWDAVYKGQQQMVANVTNNFRYSPIDIDIRIWGKAFGKYAPSVVFYAESDELSINSYGRRELRLTNSCINTFDMARKLAESLSVSPTISYSIETTGKPYIQEGDLIHVKEETTGLLAGLCKVWENTFIAPIEKQGLLPNDHSQTQIITGTTAPIKANDTGNGFIMLGDENRILEINKANTPTWYAVSGSEANSISFATRWAGSTTATTGSASYTIVGSVLNNLITILDYTTAEIRNNFLIAGAPNDFYIEGSNQYLFIAHSLGITCIDLYTRTICFEDTSIGNVNSITGANYTAYHNIARKMQFDNTGVIMYTIGNSITVQRIFNQDFTGLGEFITSIPCEHTPIAINYSKILKELTVTTQRTALYPSIIYGQKVNINFDPQARMTNVLSDVPLSVDVLHTLWEIDYMKDSELTYSFPVSAERADYINQYFSPTYAIRDAMSMLIITDTEMNRVYKVNPSGKFYVEAITQQFSRSDEADVYKSIFSLIPIDSATSMQLTNFGNNFIQQKVDEDIEDSNSIGMGRIIAVLPRDKVMVQMLTSDTIVTAINSSMDILKVNDTVILAYGIGDRGIIAVIGKKSLHDFAIETGEPYTYVDATSLDITKYGTAGTTSGTTNTDTTNIYARINAMQTQIRQLALLHGMNW